MSWKSLLEECRDRLIKRAIDATEEEFIKTWAYSCILSITEVCKHILPSIFKKYRKLLSEEGILAIYRIICCYYLAVFHRNENNISYMKNLGITIEVFEELVFKIFDFSDSDKEIYEDIDNYFDFNPAAHIYDGILSRGFGKASDKDLEKTIYLAAIMSDGYLLFMDVLSSLLEQESIKRKL